MHLWVRIPTNERNGSGGRKLEPLAFAIKQLPTNYFCLVSDASQEHRGGGSSGSDSEQDVCTILCQGLPGACIPTCTHLVAEIVKDVFLDF